MNWNNVDLDHEGDASIVDAYSFDTLLLEIACNVKDINEQSVREQFETSLRANINSAREVFEANLKNIVTKAINERNI